jgi:TRAP-type C4-dicarboxylate transport system substrate-binding protein
MKKAKWVGVLLALAFVVGLVALVAVSCGGGEETTTTVPESTTTTIDEGLSYEFIFSHAMSPMASLYSTWLVPWMAAVQEAGNGRITVKEYPDSALYEEPLQYPNLVAGQADLTLISTEFIPGTLPVFELAYLPMLFPNPEVATRVMWDLIQEYGQEELKDVKVLGLVCLTPSEYAGLMPLGTPADFVDKKFRSAGAAEHDTMAALGGIPVDTEVPSFAVYDAKTDSLKLSPDLGTVPFDGIFLSWAYMNVRGANLWATNFTQADLQYRMFILAMNKEKWETLPAVVQQAFIDTTGVEQSVTYNNDNVRVNEVGDNYAATVARAEALGTPIYVLTAEERAQWKAAVQPVIDKWVTEHAATLPSQEIMDRLNELVEQYSADSTAATAPVGAATTASSAQ